MKKIIRLLTLALLTVPVTTFAQSEGTEDTEKKAVQSIHCIEPPRIINLIQPIKLFLTN